MGAKDEGEKREVHSHRCQGKMSRPKNAAIAINCFLYLHFYLADRFFFFSTSYELEIPDR